MGAHGRPTPQPDRPAGDGPRFQDRLPEDYVHADVNPFVRSHRTWGPTLLTAEQAWQSRGKWSECFGRDNPLHVEIGPGNGFFIRELARRNPDWNVLGVEIRYKRVVLCAKKIDGAGLKNAKIARYHAAYLDDLFTDGTLSGLYINHPDPWPKIRHEKNRLISRWFLQDAARLLKPGAWLRLKSDFEDNIGRVPELLEGLPFDITGRSDDVITGPAPWPDDIETNYQKKFRLKGEPVYAIELVRT